MNNFVVRAVQVDEIPRAAELVARIFSQGNSDLQDSLYHDFAYVLPKRPRANPQFYRGAFYKNKLISFLYVPDFILRYGRAALYVAGIGAVCTDEAYRGRGYAAAVIKDTLTYAAEQGAHMVLLQGIPNYFSRFGFSSVWPRYTLQAPCDIAAKLAQALQLRIATPDDLPAIAQLYNQHWGTRITVERHAALWRWRMENSRGETALAVDGKGHIHGYIWHEPHELSHRSEIVADSPDAIMTFLAYSGRFWQHKGLDNFVWSVPPDDMIIPYAQQILPITLQASYFPSGGWMARIIDSAAMITELMPEIIAQAKAMSPNFNPNHLILKVKSDGVEIGLNSNSASFCRLSLRDFIQILFGSLRPATLAMREPLSGASIHLLETLFPPRVAAIAAWDWF
jgi:predicted N-acetyltransferase YhbS